MHKARSLFIAGAMAAGLAFLVGCDNPASGASAIIPYDMTVAPKAISVDVPSSLVKPALVARAALGRDSGDSYFSDENRGAYHWVKETMWQTQKRLARAAAKMILIDSAITANSYPADEIGTTPVKRSTTDAVWTEEQVAALMAMLPSSFASNAGFKGETKLPKAGDPAKLPDFYYSKIDPTTDLVNASYAYKVTLDPEDNEDGDNENGFTITESKNFYWDELHTMFKFSQQKMKMDNATKAETVLEMNFVAFDAAKGIMAAGRQGEEGSMSLQVKADPASTTSGVFIVFSSTIQADKAEDYSGDALAAAGTSLVFSADGYADDAGGYVNETFTLMNSGVATSTYYFKENFDSSGVLILAQTADSTFTTLTPIAAVSRSDAHDDYADKEAEVENEHLEMDSSEAAHELQKEEDHHAGEMSGAVIDFEPQLTDGQTGPRVTETWGVFAASDNTLSGADFLGKGTVIENGQVPVSFEKRPPEGWQTLYLAKVDGSNTPDLTNVLTQTRD